MARPKRVKIRPYARLLTMLGEQLIKNERIALIELIKNAYDADAEWVKISFCKFDDDYKITSESKIIIEDSGHGMTEDIIKNHWLNPATPEKKRRKKKKDTTKKGRVIQGEKGIGRFALLKLGRKINMITRAETDSVEHVVEYDFSRYDDEFLSEDGVEKDLFLDNLSVKLFSRSPVTIVKKKITAGPRKINTPSHGTFIEISNLKGNWSEKKVKEVYHDIARLQSIFSNRKKGEDPSPQKDFEVWIFRDDKRQLYEEQYLEKLNVLLDNHSVIRIEEGLFNAKKRLFTYKINDTPKALTLNEPDLTGLKVFRDWFGDAGKELDKRDVECGSFNFGFYVFDFSSNAPMKYLLDKEDKLIIKAHRIYLYRDGIRVYPYGDPEDDWLKIDAYRGTVAAGHFLSNDQVVGFVNITQKENPKLRDKTNREGLIEDGNATEDFVVLLKTFLAYIRRGPYARYRKDIENKKDYDIFRTEQVRKEFDELRNTVGNDARVQSLITRAEKVYNIERNYLTRRAEITEDLAGVGLSVETASHDILGIMSKVFSNIDAVIQDLMAGDEIDEEELLKELQAIRGGMSFIEAQLKDIQLLFVSSKQRRKNIRVKEIVDKIVRLYKRLLDKESIDYSIATVGSPLIAKTTDAVLLQLLLNLFDNSVYWLKQISIPNKCIKILLDGGKGRMIFSDNGPGVNKDDAPYIFEPFYSGKGEEGRGLGLYIARQLLERNDYSIELADLKADKILPGATFVVNFFAEDK